MRRRITPVAASVLVLLLAAAVRVPGALDAVPGLFWLAAAAGVLAAPLSAIVAAELVAPQVALWAGSLLALSPIHVLLSREAGPEALLLLSLLVTLWLLAALDRHGGRAPAVALGLTVGGLVASGVAAFAAVGILLPAFAAWRRERRAAALVAAGVALAVAAGAALLGLGRSPLDPGEIPSWIPATTPEGVVRCTGASFTRVVGLEYQLVVSHARYLLPLSALFVALMLRGAVRLPARTRGLLVAGTLLPFAVGAVLALATGRVLPLQAARLVAALPFVVLLMATGLASLTGTRAWAAGTAVAGTLASFVALALAR